METSLEYQVSLDVFHGPLDLLLYLVRQQEIDILDIPIASITEQYLKYLEELSRIDLDLVGDFLVMASTLIEIKSRTVLPRADLEDGEAEDPRQELVRQLLEYKQFKEAAEQLHEQAQQWAQRVPRLADDRPSFDSDPAREPIREVELWDLVGAYERLMRETLARAPQSIVYDETPLEVYVGRVEDRLIADGRVAFSDLLRHASERRHVVGTFLAILELVRLKRARVEQDDLFGEIWVSSS